MSRTVTVLRLGALAGWLCVTQPVRADAGASTEAPSQSAPIWLEKLQAHAELGLSGRADAKSRLWVLSPLIGLDYPFSHGFGIGFDWAFALAAEVPAHQNVQAWAAPGGPLLKVTYDSPDNLQHQLKLYAGLSVPAAWLPRDTVRRALARTGYAMAAGSRGLWNAWLWVPEQMALALGAAWQSRLNEHVTLRCDAAAAGSVSLSWLTSDAGALYAQLAPALELHAAGLHVGLRPQAVLVAPQRDPLQISLGAYLGVAFEHWSIDANALCNLDEPLGWTGSGLGVCGTWLSAEVSP